MSLNMIHFNFPFDQFQLAYERSMIMMTMCLVDEDMLMNAYTKNIDFMSLICMFTQLFFC